MSNHTRKILDAYALPVVLLITIWIALLGAPTGFGQGSFFALFDSLALLGLVAVGLGVTMIAGELDLSAGSVAAVAGMVAVHAQSLGFVAAIVVAVAAGFSFGAVQGWVIARLGISSLVLTIGSLIMMRGVAYLLGDRAIVITDPMAGGPLLTRFGVLPATAVVAGVVIAAVAVMMADLRIGREIYAIGGDREEAVAAGVRVGPPMIAAFATSGGCASLAGSIAAFQSGSATPGSFDALLLLAVSAAIIGGVALSGGRGTVLNILLGVGILTSISAGMALRGYLSYVTQLATGALLVLVIVGEWMTRRIREQSRVKAMAETVAEAHTPMSVPIGRDVS